MDELFTQTRGIFVNDEVKKEQFTKQIAFNCIPRVTVMLEGQLHQRVEDERRDPQNSQPKRQADCDLRAFPAFIGHAEAVNISSTVR